MSRALSDEDIGFKGRSLASLKRAKQKENKENQKNQNLEELKPVKRDVNIPEVITIRELANRMAEQSSNIIKHLLSMGVTATINHSINSVSKLIFFPFNSISFLIESTSSGVDSPIFLIRPKTLSRSSISSFNFLSITTYTLGCSRT